MRRKMLFFVNPNAGSGDVRASLIDVLVRFTQAGYDVTVRPTSRAREITEAVAAEGEKYDCIAAAGGDGTLNEAVSGLMCLEAPPLLAYLPGGTVNDVASSLGLPKNVLEAAKAVVSGREARIDVGSFNDRWFAYVAAFGAFTGVAYDTPQSDKRLLGRMAYLLRGVQALSEIRPIHVRVRTPAQEIEDDVILGLVTNTTSVGGFNAAKVLDASLDDGLFELVLVRQIKNLADLNAVATAITRRDFGQEYFRVLRTERAEFSFDEDVRWTLDGEFGGAVRRAVLQNHQRALRILVPAPKEPPRQ